jgi:hypothetical protein
MQDTAGYCSTTLSVLYRAQCIHMILDFVAIMVVILTANSSIAALATRRASASVTSGLAGLLSSSSTAAADAAEALSLLLLLLLSLSLLLLLLLLLRDDLSLSLCSFLLDFSLFQIV